MVSSHTIISTERKRTDGIVKMELSNTIYGTCANQPTSSSDCFEVPVASPFKTGKYKVAEFHTHPMHTSCESERRCPVGPSADDNSTQLPGFVYDWIGVDWYGEKIVYGGHSIDDAAQLYECGPTRRPLFFQ